MFDFTPSKRFRRRVVGGGLAAALIAVGVAGAQTFAEGGEAGVGDPPAPPGVEIPLEAPEPGAVVGGENTLIQTFPGTFDETILTKFVPAAAFQPLQGELGSSLDAVERNGQACVSPVQTVSSGSVAELSAPLELPDGARIKRVAFFGVDNAGADIVTRLKSEEFTSGLSFFPSPPTYSRTARLVDSFSTTGASIAPRVFSGVELAEDVGTPSGGGVILLSFTDRFHTLEVVMDNAAGSNHVLCGVEVQYQVAKSSADAGTVFHAIQPVRAFDSRRATYPAAGLLAPSANKVISIANGYDLAGIAIPTQANIVPEGATAITYNVTIAGATGSNFVAVTAGDAASFTASAINFNAVSNVANAATVSIAADRTIKLWGGDGAGSANVIVDVTGYYAPAPPIPNMAS
jgi:hypothetical protein